MDIISEEVYLKYKPKMHNVNLLVKFINNALEGKQKTGKTVCGFNLVVRNKGTTMIAMYKGVPIFIIKDKKCEVLDFDGTIFNGEKYRLDFINEILKNERRK